MREFNRDNSKFRLNLTQMNLIDNGDGTYSYNDRICHVKFQEVVVKPDFHDIPVIAVFTKSNQENSEYQYIAVVTDDYKFEGNDVIINGVKNSIRETESPIFHEYIYVPKDFSIMLTEILLQNRNNIATVGDIYPQISIYNAYNGRGSKGIQFGFSIYNGEERYSSIKFKTKIGSLKQTHIHGSRTYATSISSFVQRFNDNIVHLFEQNYNNRLSEEDILKTLDLIEKVGKKKREEISKAIQDISEQNTNGQITSWNIFLAISKFSVLEKNINVKSLLEDVAERVLILPAEMMEALT
jgi:hypothetical protein